MIINANPGASQSGQRVECAAECGFTQAFLSHSRQTPEHLNAWLMSEPGSARAHATKAFMLVSAGRGELQPQAQASAMFARQLAQDGDFRDRIYADAALAAAEGHWHAAINQLETLARLEPESLLLIKLIHALRFMLGDKAGLLYSIELALSRLSPDHPQRAFALGMHAFALEETGRYHEAERVGREAVSQRMDDVWGLHAVSHAQEMTGQIDAGIAWIAERETALRAANNFGSHLFWHLALFRLEKGEIDAVFALYDREIRAEKTDDFRDVANAASLLARLERQGHKVGHRWEELADKAEARIENRAYVFADLHHMLALIGAGRETAAERLARAMRSQNSAYSVQDEVSARVGAVFADGLARAKHDPKGAFKRMFAVRADLVTIGGSDAQRDVFEQALVDTAMRAGETDVAQTLLQRRLAGRNGRNEFATKRLMMLENAARKKTGALALLASLAFAKPLEAGHQH